MCFNYMRRKHIRHLSTCHVFNRRSLYRRMKLHHRNFWNQYVRFRINYGLFLQCYWWRNFCLYIYQDAMKQSFDWNEMKTLLCFVRVFIALNQSFLVMKKKLQISPKDVINFKKLRINPKDVITFSIINPMKFIQWNSFTYYRNNFFFSLYKIKYIAA